MTVVTGWGAGLWGRGNWGDDNDLGVPVEIPDLTGVTFTYTPPVVFDVPALDERDHGVPYRLFRHYGLRPRGVNVWKSVDGTFSTVQPFPTISVEDAAHGNGEPATYLMVFYGGHVYESVGLIDALMINVAGLGEFGTDLVQNLGGAILTDDQLAILVQQAGVDIGVLVMAGA